ncbi:MAG: hypothetical protein KAW89_08735 [Armatimonadetes bacterium]|nr:hypothetical protein [Armatimonadota bacterium]
MAQIDIDEEIERFKKSAYFAQEQENEKKVITRFQPIFTPENLDNLTAEDFKSFLRSKNNKHWWGIQRQSGHLTEDMDHLRNALRILLDESKPIEQRLDTLFPENKPKYIKFLGRAVATPILLVVYPNKYSVYNRKVELSLKACDLHPDERGMSLAQRYVKVNQVLTDLAQRHHISRFLLDWVFHRITVQVEQGKGEPSHWTSAMHPQL